MSRTGEISVSVVKVERAVQVLITGLGGASSASLMWRSTTHTNPRRTGERTRFRHGALVSCVRGSSSIS